MNRTQRLAVAQHGRTQLGLFTRAQCLGAALTYEDIRGALRRGEWVDVHAGVYAYAGLELDGPRSVLAAVLAAGPDAVASHMTAAALHGVPGFRLNGNAVHVTVPHGRRPTAVGAVVHYTRALPPHHLAPVGRTVPVTSMARTLFDLARTCHPDRVERALDNALAMPLVTMVAVERVFCDLAGPGRAGTVLMRALLDARGDGFVVPRSRLEQTFLEFVERFDLPKPRREIDLGSDQAWNGRVEFVFEHGVHVEVDGRRWHTALLDQEHDDDRDNEFIASGFAPLRVSWRMLNANPARVADQIRRALAVAASRAATA